MHNIKAHSVFSSNELFPVYRHYSNEHTPQQAFLSVDIQTGAVDADYIANTGTLPESVWHNRVLHFPIRSELTGEEIKTLINENLAKFQQIVDAVTIEWNDKNHVGVIPEDTQELIDEIQRETEFITPRASVCTLADFLGEEIFPATGQTVDEYVTELAGLNGMGDLYYSTAGSAVVDDVRDELLDLWAHHLYNDEYLPPVAAEALLTDGRCEDSQWLPELKRFAGACDE